MRISTAVLPLLALSFSALLVVAGAVHAKDAKYKEPVAEVPAQPAEPLQNVTLPMYEWGVEAISWDGSARTKGDVPAFYYEPAEVPLSPRPETPQPEPKPDPDPEPGVKFKPVIYFAPAENMDISVEIRFAAGKVTWMYPKPSRLIDASTVQWDTITLDAKRAADDPQNLSADLAKVEKDHWAAFSREGSTCDLATNGEHERFLFYEGTNTDLPEIDVLRNAQGEPVVRNYSSHAIYSVRLKIAAEGDATKLLEYFAAKVEAAGGETPGEQKLSLVPVDRISRSTSELADEVKAAGLTEKQAAVFDRCWHKEIMDCTAGVLSYRRDGATLDDQTPITVKSPGRNIKLESHRIGYLLVSKVDISAARQAELDALALQVADGDQDAGDKLGKLGMAGIGALRRALVDMGLNLKQRVAIAAQLKRIQQDLAR